LIRDVLLQHGTPIALTDYAYLLTAFAGAAASYLANVQGLVWDRVWPVIDAVALGCWATAGATKTVAVGIGWLPALLLGVVTAVGGGARSGRGAPAGSRHPWWKHFVRDRGPCCCGSLGVVDRCRVRQGRFGQRPGGRRGTVPGREVAWLDPAERRRMVTGQRRPGPLPRASQ
jgi:hypothetical protein